MLEDPVRTANFHTLRKLNILRNTRYISNYWLFQDTNHWSRSMQLIFYWAVVYWIFSPKKEQVGPPRFRRSRVRVALSWRGIWIKDESQTLYLKPRRGVMKFHNHLSLHLKKIGRWISFVVKFRSRCSEFEMFQREIWNCVIRREAVSNIIIKYYSHYLERKKEAIWFH